MKEHEKSKRTSHHWPSCANSFLKYRSSKSYVAIFTILSLVSHEKEGKYDVIAALRKTMGKMKVWYQDKLKVDLLEILQAYRIR